MKQEAGTYSEVASPSILLRVQFNPAPASPVVTTVMPYESVKHLLSAKPLRRPSRNRLTGK